MFRGNNPARVDDKGRLKIPADVKRVIDEKYARQFYITSFDGKVAKLYPLEEWERVEQKLQILPISLPARQQFVFTTSYYGRQVEMDDQGRVLLPQTLREEAGLTAEVDVIGSITHLEIHNHTAAEAAIKAKPLTMEDLQSLADLGF